jgi:hypothetical protein
MPQALPMDISASTNKPSANVQFTTLELWYPHTYYVMVRLTVIISSVASELGDVYQGFWADSSGAGIWMGWKKLTN